MKNITAAGFVYFIEAVGTPRIKLGYSVDPEKRLKELQTGSPYKLALLAKWPAIPQTETYLHELFTEYRVHGEWFELPQILMEQLLKNDRKAKNPEIKQEDADDNDPRLWRLDAYHDRHGKVRVRKVLRFVPKPEVKIELGVMTDELAAQMKNRPGRGRWGESRLEAQALRLAAIGITDKLRIKK